MEKFQEDEIVYVLKENKFQKRIISHFVGEFAGSEINIWGVYIEENGELTKLEFELEASIFKKEQVNILLLENHLIKNGK